jgi:hypothetical protein
MRNKSIGRGPGQLAAGGLICVWAAVANAEIRQFSATVESEVKESVDGSPSDSDFAFDSFPGVSTSNLPMTTNAGFTRADSSGKTIAEGRAITNFSDPRLSDQPSPEEFGISTIAFSTDAQLSHQSRCTTTETRTIVFTATDAGFADGTAIRVRSQFFLDGIVALWTNAGVDDLSNVTATLHVEVLQDRTATGSATVLATDVTLTGTPDNKSVLTMTGALGEGNVVRLDLNGLVTNLNAVQAVTIPDIAIPYEYDATVGESFTLKATVTATVNSEPGGRGAGIVLGVPLQDLARLVNEISGTGIGDTLAGSLTSAALAARPLEPLPPAKGVQITAVSPAEGLLPPFCGALGLETAALALTLGCIAFFRGRRW